MSSWWSSAQTKADIAAVAGDGLLLLQQRLDRGVLLTIRVVMVVAALAAAIQLVFTLLFPTIAQDQRNLRLLSCIGVLAFAGFTLLIARHVSTKRAAQFLSWGMLGLLCASAWIMDYGLASTGLGAFGALIVVGGLMAGARTARDLTAAAIGFLILMAVGTQMGWTGSLSQITGPRQISYLTIHAGACLICGWMVGQYGKLFWEVISGLEASKKVLQNTLQTEQASAQQLADSELRLRSILDNSLNAILIFDIETAQVRYANAVALARHGVASLQEVTYAMMYPGGAYTLEASREMVHRAAHTGAVHASWKTQDWQGQAVWWDLKLDRMTLNDEPCVVCFGHDITARVEADEALRDHQLRLEAEVQERTEQLRAERQRMQDIIEALPITLSIRDREGRYLLVNRCFERALGLNREDVVGQRAQDLLPAATVEDMMGWDGKVLAGEGDQTFERPIPNPDGVRRDYLITSVPLLDEQRKPFAVLNLGTDVSSLKQLQRELALAKEEAERLAQAKSEFLANMSHEIRTPLNAVLGVAQLGVRRSAAHSPEHADYERILSSGRYLLGVINDILDYSKLDSGKLEINDEPCELQVLLTDAAELVSERARAKGLDLQVLVAPELPRWVRLDGLRVSQILLNLLSNAVKFTSQGLVCLEARPEGDGLMLSVTDTGVGIAPEHLGRIFDPFEQADSSTTRHYGGTGLGLAISRRLAVLMSGQISVSSVVGQGACFSLQLPLIAMDHPLPASPADTSEDVETLQGLRLLVVDDVEINRTIIQAMLRECGASAQCVSGGEAALARLRAQPDAFDAVLMDLQMPGMDGFEATRLVHDLIPDLPVVALTAHAMDEERRKCLEVGMVAHITKPVDMVALSRILQRSLRGRTAQNQMPASNDVTPASANPVEDAPRSAVPPAAAESPWPNLPGFDQAGALARCGGQADILRKVLLLFKDQLQRLPQELSTAQRQGPQALGAVAHRLKGVSGNLGLQTLLTAAELLENRARQSAPQGLDDALEALQQRLAEVTAALASWGSVGETSSSQRAPAPAEAL